MAICACAGREAPPTSSASETVLKRDFIVMGFSSGLLLRSL